MNGMRFKVTGKMSVFGGPDDRGVGPAEDLALVFPADIAPRTGKHWFRRCFLDIQPPATTGMARRLNPNAFYIACRWPYAAIDAELSKAKDVLRWSVCKVMANGIVRFAQPVDFGPGDGTEIDGRQTQDTGRVADLSPALANALGLKTDDVVTVELLPAD